MKLLEQLHRWRNHFRQQGNEPAFIPLTAEELTVVVSNCPYVGQLHRFEDPPPVQFANAFAGGKLFGCDVFESPFAPTMRQRQIDMPVTQLEESAEVSMYREICSEDRVRNILHRRLVAHICSDTTTLKLTFEWDILAKLKRKFRLTRVFPVRTRTVAVQGQVLYPYINVTLPHNKHHVQFQHIK